MGARFWALTGPVTGRGQGLSARGPTVPHPGLAWVEGRLRHGPPCKPSSGAPGDLWAAGGVCQGWRESWAGCTELLPIRFSRRPLRGRPARRQDVGG